MFRRVLVGLGLFFLAGCIAQQANAQAGPNVPGSESPSALVCGQDDVDPDSGQASQIQSFDESSADLLAKKKAKLRTVLTLSAADPGNGVKGVIENFRTGSKRLFESRKSGDQLIAQIKNKDGFTLVEYIESQQEMINAAAGESPKSEWVPSLRINGIEYSGYTAEIDNEIKAIVSS